MTLITAALAKVACLVELAMVLVVAGLLTGGIFKGQQLLLSVRTQHLKRDL